MKENIDYELIPGEGENWDVRILDGTYVESVLRFGELRVSDDEEYLAFNFDVVSSPDGSLDDTDPDLQEHATKILQSVLENAIMKDLRDE